jgi:hypothetical protein
MNAKLKPWLEWIALMVIAVGIGLGLAWLPVEKSTVQMGFLVIGGLGLAYVFYLVFQLSKASDDFDMSNWPADPDDEPSVSLEVKP